MNYPKAVTGSFIINNDKVLLIRWGDNKGSWSGKWTVPGGKVEYGEKIEDAVKREAKEETNLSLRNLKQFHVYSNPRRDPRGHTVTLVFTADGYGKLKAQDDAVDIKIFNKNFISL